jgi:hypothetical protein
MTAADCQFIAENLDALRAGLAPVFVWDPATGGYDARLADEWSYAVTGLTTAAPEAYKPLSVQGGKPRFGKIEGPAYGIDESGYTSAHLKVADETAYGEYELDFSIDNDNNFPIDGTGVAGVRNDDGREVGIRLEGGGAATFQVVGALVKTDGGTYAMRQMENLWWGNRFGLEISWSAGVTEYVHGSSVLDSVNYADTMGKRVLEVVFLSEKGYFTFEWPSDIAYLPYVLRGDSYALAVEPALAADGEAGVSIDGLPADFVAECSVDGLSGAAVAGGKLTWDAPFAAPGEYALSVRDGSGKYAGVSTTFTLTTDEMPAAWDGARLAPAAGATQEALGAFLRAIASVNVNGVDYPAAGRGATAILDADGAINQDAGLTTDRNTGETSGTPVFGAPGEYRVTVTATGYNQALEFVYTK